MISAFNIIPIIVGVVVVIKAPHKKHFAIAS